MSATVKKITFLAVAFFFCFQFFGCSTRQSPTERLEFPSMHIEVDPKGQLPARFWDTYTLFNRANRLYDEKRFKPALAEYLKVVEADPDDRLAVLSLFNAALCLEELGRYEKALAYYKQIEHKLPEEISTISLRFRFAYCYENLKEWNRASGFLAQIETDPKATPLHKTQAQARIAIATFYLDNQDKAKPLLRAAMKKYENLRSRKIPIDNNIYAKTCFTLGEFYYNRFEEVKLDSDARQLEMSLENKATLFILARAQYLKAIKTYETDFLFASLFRIGNGYENFYFSMYNAPIPDDLEPGEDEEYKSKLVEKIAPVFKKALEMYGRNLKLGADLKENSKWLDKSRERLDYLQQWQQENL